jgi:cystathionine gamma-synthase
MFDEDLAPETVAAHGGRAPDPVTGAVVPPIHMSTTFAEEAAGLQYTRPESPAHRPVEELLAHLEGGDDAALFASGQAAATALFCSLAPGDHVVVARSIYFGLRNWLAGFGVDLGLDVSFVDATDLDDVAGALRPGRTRLVWVETPANPTWDVVDLAAVAGLAHDAGARLVVDSTSATPVLTRPIEHGADLVMHSATKFLNGHSDVLAGALVTAAADPLWQRVLAWRRLQGAVPGTVESWLLLRGMRTLHLRVREASTSAAWLAARLVQHPNVAEVLHPSLPGRPGHLVATRQMDGGFGGMFSIRVAGGVDAAARVVRAVRLWRPATSLGGVESLIEHRAPVEGAASTTPADLLRCSTGVEAPADLLADLDQALRAAHADGAVVDPVVSASDPVDRVLHDELRPLLAARAGGVRRVEGPEGTVRLVMTGSPGASMPLLGEIGRALRRVDGVDAVEVVGVPSAAAGIETVLDEAVRPALAEHGGCVEVVAVNDGVASIRLDGGCRGCVHAERTVRHGIEPLVRAAVPDVEVVRDVTDHADASSAWAPPGAR